ncbi:MAG: zinc-ribbon domain-containing protein [Clostridiales Family XIII bacterium]|jgi:hypothetical protein|nr:zinc-ribbon domain-containing protein [Clostridiales Family XIII bacterium]
MKSIKTKRMVYAGILLVVVAVDIFVKWLWGEFIDAQIPTVGSYAGAYLLSGKLGLYMGGHVPFILEMLFLLSFAVVGFLPVSKKAGFSPIALILLLPAFVCIVNLIGYIMGLVDGYYYTGFESSYFYLPTFLSFLLNVIACLVAVYLILAVIITIISAGKGSTTGMSMGFVTIILFYAVASFLYTVFFFIMDLVDGYGFDWYSFAWLISDFLTIITAWIVGEQVRLLNKGTKLTAKTAEGAPAGPTYPTASTPIPPYTPSFPTGAPQSQTVIPPGYVPPGAPVAAPIAVTPAFAPVDNAADAAPAEAVSTLAFTPVDTPVTPAEPAAETPAASVSWGFEEAVQSAAPAAEEASADITSGINETVETAAAEATPAFCTNCGSPLVPGAGFCTSCGNKVG